MKKILALFLAALVALSLAACGGKTPEAESTSAAAETTAAPESETADPATQPEVGRVREKGAFYVYIPDDWCKMEYTGDDTRIRLFDIPSATKIKDDTAEIEINAEAKAAEKDSVKKAVAALLKNEGAKEGKQTKIDGEAFSVVTYTNKEEKRDYTVYVGLGGGSLATVTLKGIAPSDEDAAAVLRSLSFK